jgi:hypothetical protein
MSDACVMQGRAPTPLIPPAGVTPARERYAPYTRYIAQPEVKRAAPHKSHPLVREHENVLGTNTVANMRIPLKGYRRQCSPHTAEQCSPMFAVRQNVRFGPRIAGVDRRADLDIRGFLDRNHPRLDQPAISAGPDDDLGELQ